MSSFNKRTKNPGWRPGSHWVECQRTGMLIRSGDAMQEWTGLIVAKEEWEPRHPQDLLRGRADDMTAKGLVNPESAENFVAGGGTIAIAGFAVAGEAVAGVGYGTDIPSGSFAYPAGHDSIS